MGIMDIFKQAPAPVAPAQGPNPGQLPANAAAATSSTSTAATAPNGVVPASTDLNSAAKSPLDAFNDLWQTDPNAAPTTGQPLFNVKQEDLLTAAQAQNFTSHITPEQLAAIAAGGEGAIKAFSDSLNATAQHVYARSAFATTKIVENALGKAEQTMTSRIPGMIRQHNVSDGLRTENPAFAHPAAQPIISALEQQMSVKHPQATAKELRDMATQYLGAFAGAFNPATTESAGNPNSRMSAGTDWSTFL